MSSGLLARSIPVVGWLPRYTTGILRSDLSAGLTTAVMLIPQGMAYAMLAGLPPIVGLYASTVPLVVYAALGSSRQLSVGPMAMASLLVAAGIHELLTPAQMTPANLVATAITLTMLAGIFQVLMGVFRLGGLVNLLSHPVVTGFTSAAAIIIGASQIQHVVGFEVPRGLTALQTMVHVGENIGAAHVLTVVISAAAIGLLVGLRNVAPRLPAALIAVVLGILASWLIGLDALGVNVLGDIPSGLPTPKLPRPTYEAVVAAAPMGLAIALVGFMESISAAKVYARQNRYEISPGQELVSLGLSNVSAGLFGGYTVGGALSRTAVNAQAGAKTPMANVFTAITIVLTLVFLTPIFSFLPTPILAAIILVAVTGLLDFQEWVHLWRVKKDDLVLLLITFFATLFGTIESGILVGVGASLLWLVYTTTRPAIATLGRVPGTNTYRSVKHFSDAEMFDRILILRMDAQFFFGNVAHLRDALFRKLDRVREPVGAVLDASSMNGLDSTAADTFEALIRELRQQGVEIFVSHVKGSVLAVMRDTGILEQLGEGHIFYEVHDAVEAAIRHRQSVEKGVPLEQEDFGASDMVD